MANVSFKKGSESNLWGLQTSNSIVEGAFYLTTDTHRLYIGQNVTESGTTSTKLFPVNEGVITVQNLGQLPDVDPGSEQSVAGNFYYVSGSNILCVWNGREWVQINPDTRITTAEWDVDGQAKEVQLVLGVNQQGTSPISSPVIKFEGNSVTVSEDEDTGEVTVSVADVAIPNLNVTWGNSTLSVVLGNKNFSLTQGQNITLTENTEGGKDIVISAVNMRTSSVVITPKSGQGQQGFDVSAIRAEDNQATTPSNFDPTIKVSNAPNEVVRHFVNGQLDLTSDYYTKTEVDKKITDFDAVEYRGVWPSGSTWPQYNEEIGINSYFPSTDIKKGYMYMIGTAPASPIVIDGKTVKSGDLIIATGTETNGLLTTIDWELVPAGNEIDTTYGFELNSTNNIPEFIVTNNNDNSSNRIFGVKGEGSEGIIQVVKGDNDNIEISHKTITAGQPTSASYSPGNNGIAVLTGVNRDGYGHVTGLTTTTLPSPVELNSLESDLDSANNIATYEATILQKFRAGGNTTYGDSFSFNFKIKGEEGISVSTLASDTTQQNAPIDTISIGMVWESFDS